MLNTSSNYLKTKHFAHLFENLSFANTFCKETLADPLGQLNKTRQVLGSMYSYVDSTPLEKAKYAFDPSSGRLLPTRQQVSEDFDDQDEERNNRSNILSSSSSSSVGILKSATSDKGVTSDFINLIDYNRYSRFEFVMASNSVAKECLNGDLLSSESGDERGVNGVNDLITVEHLMKQQEKEHDLDNFVNILSGYDLVNSTKYYAHCYGGFQFGNWAGQLGDGRAISMGQVETPFTDMDSSGFEFNNSRNSYNYIKPKRLWELQFKGAGHTPFSRHADGRAVLRSSIREFLGSEFMDSLGIATTRAFSLVRSKEKAVLRDEFYDNNPKYEYGAIVLRVAPTFVRFGSFDIFNYRYHPINEKEKALEEKKNIEVLARYVIKNHFPHLWINGDLTLELKEKFSKEIVRRTAKLCADWMSVGFVHGVLNTDNMSILGLTIDYGPFGFVDYFSEDFVPNNSDSDGRYRYKNQPAIVFWNLQKLMRAFTPTLLPEEYFAKVLNVYAPHFEHYYLMNFRKKLGLISSSTIIDTSEDVTNFDMFDGDSENLRNEDWELIEGFLAWMNENRADFTNFFRLLSNVKKGAEVSQELLDNLLQTRMHADHTPSETTVSELKNWLSIYTKRLESVPLSDEERKTQMDKTNPRYILRNYIAQKVIKSAEEFDYGPLYEYYNVLRNPYDNHSTEFEEKFGGNAPLSSRCLKLSCSS
ncbi:UPF0061 domain-containing protein [Naegleria gruberi]|uniref:Selenoprotein O n=1 Tax=Naegleria gruberi TaxID=5762 RepID=D2VSW5_NAEGR|nr:UPF0061 domain-containing protein [Naegleria gruberi]EFC39972.1 UPF0061 domain-containing protein [Naegleria gruberi]|eukprot:XP_002672716.1 UPF0061 domain-containing protein [Naegleria gruberi strain NEG-M]